MTLPESRKATFVEIAKWTVIGALVGGGLTVAYLMSRTTTGDDDRPPIIVRNGSVDLVLASSTDDANPGEFKKNTAPKPNKQAWFHDFGTKGKNPNRMAVSVAGVDSASCSNSPFFFAQRVTDLAIAYSSQTLGDRELRIYLEGQGANATLQIELDDTTPVDQPNIYSLTVDPNPAPGPPSDPSLPPPPATARMTSVTLNFAGANSPVTCKFGGTVDPQITVLQRK